MALVPGLPKEVEEFVNGCLEVENLRQHPGFQKFLDALDELRSLNYLDILNSADSTAMIAAVGEARALFRVRGLLDERVREGRHLIETLDGSSQAFRQRKEAERRAYSPRPPSGPRRSTDSF